MKLGLLADIHEDVQKLEKALDALYRVQVDQVVVLGDIFDTGEHLEPTVQLLVEAGAAGIWGNHELGLCHQPAPHIQARYSQRVLNFMASLLSHWEIEDCLFSHGLPHWDATEPTVYYLGERPETEEGRHQSFAAFAYRVCFVGHFHRWLTVTPGGSLAWDGNILLQLDPHNRYLIVVHAVCAGWCAVFDTLRDQLIPLRCS